MEKEKSIVNNAFLRTHFTPIIYKTIAFHLILRVGKVKNSIKINKYLSDSARDKVLNDQIKTDKSIRDLLGCLRELEAQSLDVVAEVLKQSDMESGYMATVDHDFLMGIFREQMTIIKGCVAKGDYEAIYRRMKDISTKESVQ